MMKINRKKTIKKLISELGYTKYINNAVLETLKNEGDTEVEVEFFKVGKYISLPELIKEYKKRGIVPDIGAVIQYLKENPETLDDKKWIAVQLEDNSCVFFDRWSGERGVDVDRSGYGWRDYWWFGGVRKSSALGNSELSEPLPFEMPKELIINNVRYLRQ